MQNFFIPFCFIFLFLLLFTIISLKILSDQVTCIGIYHDIETEKLEMKILKLIKYNILLSFSFFFAFYIYISQLIKDVSVGTCIIVASFSTIIILVSARILSNPTKYMKPIECVFYEGNKQKICQEVLKVKERTLSFFFAFTSVTVITIVVKTLYYQMFSNMTHVFKMNYTQNVLICVISFYIFLISLTIIGEIVLVKLNPIHKDKKDIN